jgi:protein-arginine kinase activator protein McsA
MLRDLLQKAVESERFEDAAQLRDQLKLLEEEA